MIIPTYNEADNILKIIPLILENSDQDNEYNILVVDDNSPDGTAKLVEDLNNNHVNILKREKKTWSWNCLCRRIQICNKRKV